MNNANAHPDQNTTEDTREIHPAVLSWALVIGLIVAFAVTASSFKLSFTTLLDLGSMAGLRDSAWVIPVVLDGPILAASIFRIALSQHTDRATVSGRRFIIAVFALAGVASMAGNAYHAVLTVTDLNAAVAAMMGALAPLMVMTMGEMMSVAISAPRRRIIIAAPVAGDDASTGPASVAAVQDPAVENPASRPFEAVGVEEDLDNGLLKPAVWTSVHLYLANPDWSFSDIARHLELHTSTVSRHIKTWTQVQQNIAAERSTSAPTVAADQAHSATTDVDGDHSADDAIEAGSGYDADEYDSIAAGRDYAGATR